MKMKPAIFILGGYLAGTTMMFAQTTLTWRPEAANGNWSDANNWTDGVNPQSPGGFEVLRFDNAVQLTMANNLAFGGTNRHRIYFDIGSGPRTVNGSIVNAFNEVTGSSPLIRNDSGNVQTINFPIANANTNGSGALDIDAANGNLVFGGGMSGLGGFRTNIFKGAGNITVSGNIANGSFATLAVRKSGAGTLTLSGNNSFGGGILLEDGELALNAGTSAGSGVLRIEAGADRLSGSFVSINNAIEIAPGAMPQIRATGNFNLNGTISGDGGLLPSAGAVYLMASNSFAGGVTITNGALQIGNKHALGTGAFVVGDPVTPPGSTIQFAAISSAMTGVNSVTNPVVINRDLFIISGSQDVEFSGPVTLNAERSILSAGNLTFSGLISGPYGLIFSGAANSAITLAASNSYSGNTTISPSTVLSISDVANLGSGSRLTNFGTLRITGPQPATINRQIYVGGAFDIQNPAGVSISSGVTGIGSVPAVFIKTGIGGLTLNGNITNFTSVTHHQGELNVNSPILPTSTRFFVGAGIGFTPATNATLNWSCSNLVTWINLANYNATNYQAVLNVSNGWMLVNSPGSGGLEIGQSGNGQLNVFAGNVIVSNLTPMIIAAPGVSGTANGRGTLNLFGPGAVTVHGTMAENITFSDNSAAAIGTINLNGGVLATSRALKRTNGAGHLNFDGGLLKALGHHTNWLQLSSATVNVGGAVLDTGSFSVTNAQPLLHDSNVATDGGLTKLGAGKLSLLASNSFNGDTLVSSGTLALVGNGSLPTSPRINVSATAILDVSGAGGGVYGLVSGQTLVGNGSVIGTIALASGTTVAPGSSIGILTFDSPPILNGTTIIEISRTNSPNSDRLVLTSGTLTLGGALIVTNIGPADFADGDIFQIFVAPAYAGGFTSIELPDPGPGLSWNTNTLSQDGTLRVRPSNYPPEVLNPVADQAGTYGTAFEFVLPAATFTDADAGQTLSYTASGLPPGISFTPATRTFDGTPTEIGSNWVTVVATDDGNPALNTNTSFAIVIGKATLVVNAISKTNLYGDFIFVSPFVDLSYSGFQFFDSLFDLDVFPDVTTVATNGAPVGVYPITVSGGVDDKYNFVFNDGTLTVQPADLVVVVDNHCRPFGQTNPPLTVSLLGIQFGDNITAQLNTIATTNSPLGDYPITVALDDPDGKLTNYLVTTLNGMLSVVDYSVDYGIVRSFGFTNFMGGSPLDLILGSDGILYGAVEAGIFRVNRDGSGYSLLRRGDAGPLFEATDGWLYGMSQSGGSNSVGALFKLQRDGASAETLIHFSAEPDAGYAPAAALVQGTNGMLYGTTESGGTHGGGIIFRVDTNGNNFVVLHNFANGDGYWCTAPLMVGSDGSLYGVTRIGGPAGGGTVYKLAHDGSGFAVLHAFGVTLFQVAAPQGALLEGIDGALYGVTSQDGPDTVGTIFKLNKDGSDFAVIHDFTLVADGHFPSTGLVRGTNGLLYGVTPLGGADAASLFDRPGTAFSLSEVGTNYSIRWNFSEGPGSGPKKLIAGGDGNLYGVAQGGAAGSGVVFRLAEDGNTNAAIWNFNNTGGDGSKPLATLIEGRDGSLYGVSSEGGSAGKGTIYKVNKDGTGQTTLHNFTGLGGDGMNPNAQLVQASDDWLYGIAPSGVGGAGDILFRVQTNGVGYTILHHFSFPDYQSASAVIEGTDGMFYGTFSLGGAFFGGAAFKIGRDGSGFTILRSFNGSDGNTPQGLIQGNDGLLYGANYGGGNFSAGTLYKMDTNGGNFSVVHEFNSGDDTFNPTGRLHRDAAGVLFGAANYGGEIGYGTIYRVNSDGSGFQILHGFRGTVADGAYPSGSLVESATGMLYGTTTGDEFSGLTSTVFQLSKTGSNYCVLHVLDAGPGDSRYARSGLVYASDGRFYGTAKLGGDSGLGTVYRFGLDMLELNSRPIVLNPIPDQTNSYGGVLNFTFAADTFTDPDPGQTLTYAASNLPPGISFNGPSRTFSGTPTNLGTYAVSVVATDDGVPALSTNHVFNIMIDCPAVWLSPESLLAATSGTPYSQIISATGGVPPYAFAISGGALPPGVTLETNGWASGVPVLPGLFSFTVTATDSLGCSGNSNYVLNVACPVISIQPSATNLPFAISQLAYSNLFTASGGSGPFSFRRSTAPPFHMPAGLSTITSDGLLAGTPQDYPLPAGGSNYTFTVIATNATGCAGTNRFYLHVLPIDTVCAEAAQLNLAIPPAGTGGAGLPASDTTISTVEISGQTELNHANHITVAVSLEHPAAGDLILTLVSPRGERVLLANQRGGADSNYTATVFLNDAPQSIVDANPPFAGSFRPEQGLAFVGGTNLNGTWTLEIQDVVSGNAGVLRNWCLSLEKATPSSSLSSMVYQPNVTGSTLATDSHLLQSLAQTYVANFNTNLICVRTLDGGLVWTQSIANAQIGRPLPIEQSFDRPPLVLLPYNITTAGGEVRALNPTDGAALWSRRLASCSSGVKINDLQFQSWDLSDATFRAAHPTADLVFAATERFSGFCGNPDTNRIYALRATDGTVAWGFNSNGVHKVGGAKLTLDVSRNTLFCSTDKPSIGSVTTNLWAINSVNGAVRWGRNLADAATQAYKPLLANGALYVTVTSNSVYSLIKLNPDTGATVWSYTLSGGSLIRGPLAFDAQRSQIIVPRNGVVEAVTDNGAAATAAWSYAPALCVPGVAPVVVPEHDRVYVSLGSPENNITALTLAAGELTGYAPNGANAFTEMVADSHNGGASSAALMLLPLQRLPIPRDGYCCVIPGVNDVRGDLLLGGSVAPVNPVVGQPFTCTLTVTNGGTNTIAPVHLGEVLPPGLGYVSVTISRGTYSLTSNRFTADLGTLPTGRVATVSLVLTSSVSGSVSHRAMVGAYLRDFPGTNNSVVFTHNLNANPIVLNPIPSQTNFYGDAFDFSFPANTFSDPNAGQTLSYAASNLPPGIVFDGPTRTFSGICSNAGAFAVTVTATDNGSPLLDTNAVFNIVVNKAPLLATADDKARGYGAPNPPLTISYTGFVLGDTEAGLNQAPLAGTGAEPGSPVGTYPITLTGGSDDNYEFALTNGVLTVTPAALTVTAANTNRPYGQANPPLTGTLVGITNSDPITVDFFTTADSASFPGDYPIFPSWNDPSNRLGNYTITTNLGVLTVDCISLITVTNSNDSGPGTLRDALIATCPGGTINFAVTGVLALTSGHLQPAHSINIVGPGATNLTLSGGNAWRILDITNGLVSISGLTIANGDDSADFLVGAGIRNNAQLTLTECVLSNNTSHAAGGAIFNRPAGVLQVDRCLFVGNRALGAFQGGGVGGAIANQGQLFATNSTFSANRAGFSAGAIRSTGGMIIESCTFSANTASECTDCGGIPSIVAQLETSAIIHNSIFGGNTNTLGAFRDLAGVIDFGDYNLVEFASGYIGAGTNDLLGLSPQLAPLADNGGPTWTHLPLTGSPVIDAADPSIGLTLDQRGFVRPENTRADIGAVETTPAALPPTLFITQTTPTTVTVSWSPATPGFVLQTNTTLNPSTWGDSASGGTNPVGFTLSHSQLFFRLRN